MALSPAWLEPPLAAAFVAIVSGSPFLVGSQEESPAPFAAEGVESPADERERELIERGEYLVREVAMCHECHTPRDSEGEILETELLSGAPIPVEQPEIFPRWGFRAPPAAALPGYTDEEATRLLTRGITRRGTRPRPPMPRYGLSEEDAEAVIAYLRSLAP